MKSLFLSGMFFLLVATGFQSPLITDEEKAVMADQFLLERTIALSKLKNCEAYLASYDLMLARKQVRSLYPKVIKTEPREDIIKILEYNIRQLNCQYTHPAPGMVQGENLSPAPAESPIIIRYGPGGVKTGRVVPLDVYLYSMLSKDQREQLQRSLSPESQKILSDFETRNKDLYKDLESYKPEEMKWEMLPNEYKLPGDNKIPSNYKAQSGTIDINRLKDKKYTDSIRKTKTIDDF